MEGNKWYEGYLERSSAEGIFGVSVRLDPESHILKSVFKSPEEDELENESIRVDHDRMLHSTICWDELPKSEFSYSRAT